CFFSSRRRHTRSKRDWSSDVCSSDLLWLDVNHPKLNIVKHEDFIPEEYLPTFSARPIELNLHRIEGLAEQFVYFNDDMFMLDFLKKDDFFFNGMPCDVASLDVAIKADEAHGTSVYNSVL